MALSRGSAAERLTESLEPSALASLVRDILERNPGLQAIDARSRAMAHTARARGLLPDPRLGATAWLASPETRVGPQDLAFTLSQTFPWPGTTALRSEATRLDALALRGDRESMRLQLVTETRRLYWELAFLDEQEALVRADREVLSRFEDLARTRYAAGTGLHRAPVQMQVDITRDDQRLLDIERHRATLLARLDGLRGSPGPAPQLVPVARPPWLDLDASELRALAIGNRPELERTSLQVESAARRVDLAHRETRPELTLSVMYTVVSGRGDAPGRANPPEDNGKDAVGAGASINLPLWRGRVAAGVDAGREQLIAARAAEASVVGAIDADIADLVAALRLGQERLRLLEEVLVVQARESLRSGESAYGAGTINALDLLDAERALLEAQVAIARTRADLRIDHARLEGAVGTPIPFKKTDAEDAR